MRAVLPAALRWLIWLTCIHSFSLQAEDFVKDLAASREELVATHAYRLKAEQAEARHYGELSCRAYRESLLGVLPHAWNSRLDTRLELARFEKQREGKGAQVGVACVEMGMWNSAG